MAFLKLKKAVFFFALLLAAITTVAVVEGQDDQQELDCSFQGDPVKLDDNGIITLHHIANPNDGTFIAEITYSGGDNNGWVAFGKAGDETGQMAGGQVIIGLPEEVAGESNPGKYAISAKNLAGVNLMNEQTLMDSTIEQNDGDNNGGTKTTVLRYTKLLKEDGEHEIYVTEPNTFIWAYGNSNTFGYHGTNQRGSVTLPFLKICKPVVVAADDTDTDTAAENDETPEGSASTTTDGDEVESPPAAQGADDQTASGAAAAAAVSLRFGLLSVTAAAMMFYYVYL